MIAAFKGFPCAGRIGLEGDTYPVAQRDKWWNCGCWEEGEDDAGLSGNGILAPTSGTTGGGWWEEGEDEAGLSRNGILAPTSGTTGGWWEEGEDDAGLNGNGILSPYQRDELVVAGGKKGKMMLG